jgi:error-prone DNA polymerase
MMPPAASYVPLWCKSNFSFLEGASHPEELVTEAARLGLGGLALTDRDGVYGVVRAHQRAKELGFPLLIGSEVTLEDDTRLILLAQNRPGYTQLCRLLTTGRLRQPKGESRVSWDEVCSHGSGLIALWGGAGSRILADSPPDSIATDLKGAFGDRLYALLTRHLLADDVSREETLRARARRYDLPLVASTEVLYHDPARRALQDVLTCIRHSVSLATAGTLLKANAEHALRSPDDLERLFSDVPDAVARTQEIAERCTFSLSDLRYRYPSEQLPDGTSTSEYLRTLTSQGAHDRYGEAIPMEVRDQIERELTLIEQLDYPGYFLTMREIVDYCRDHDILCQGRGSAANSAVCFCLGITAIDPVRMGLLFERFISAERAEPPDIDLDIEHERREEVIQHVYERYGRTHAAMVAVAITYRPRSAIRDVGKALGLPETELGRLSKHLGHFGGFDAETLQEAQIDTSQPTYRLLLELANTLLDFPRHLSIHPGGFLLGHEPVHDLVPIENGTMEGRTVIQWDKNDVEALGLFKVDLLGLGTLTHLHRCFDLIRQHRDKDLTLATVPPEDEKTYAMLGEADTIGVFQIESRAQMAMLPRLKPRSYYDLVIEISLVRPGPISGGMVHPYLRRRREEEEADYPLPLLEPVLSKTLGIPLFQEQVMKLAVLAADYTPGEADQLRRDMAAWRKCGRIQQHRERLISRMLAKGIPLEFAERVFKQIEGFGDYGFPEAHAASFALLSYVGSYLRCHYRPEFTCSLLNSQPMGFYSPATIVGDAQRHGIEIRPISLLESQWDCTLEPTDRGLALRMGLRYVKSLSESDWQCLQAAAEQGVFTSLSDVVRRTGLDEGALTALAEAGAFDCLGKTRRQALWEVRGLVHQAPLPLPVEVETEPAFNQLSLFESINWDYERTNHSPRGHPLEPLRPRLQEMGLPDARSLAKRSHGEWVRYAGLVICRQRPQTASGVTFMTLEDETGFVNLVVWPTVWKSYARMARTVGFLGVEGRLQVQEEVVHLIVESFWPSDLIGQPAKLASRDFH